MTIKFSLFLSAAAAFVVVLVATSIISDFNVGQTKQVQAVEWCNQYSWVATSGSLGSAYDALVQVKVKPTYIP